MYRVVRWPQAWPAWVFLSVLQHSTNCKRRLPLANLRLVQAYEAAFAPAGFLCAQILLSHDDVKSRDRYLNARATLQTLLSQGVIPIVNENDTVVTDEIRFGDNDTLAALVANLIDADALLMLTDQQGLFDADPRAHADAKLVEETDAHNTALDAMVSEGSTLGRGGMVSKLRAARLAARSGTVSIIADGRDPHSVSWCDSRSGCGHVIHYGAAAAACSQAVACLAFVSPRRAGAWMTAPVVSSLHLGGLYFRLV